MPVQSEQILEEGLIKTLIENSYERVILNDENELKSNSKLSLRSITQTSSSDTAARLSLSLNLTRFCFILKVERASRRPRSFVT